MATPGSNDTVVETVERWTRDHDPSAREALVRLAADRHFPGSSLGALSPCTVRAIGEGVDYFLSKPPGRDVAERFYAHVTRCLRLQDIAEAIEQWRRASGGPGEAEARNRLITAAVGELRRIAGKLGAGSFGRGPTTPEGVTELVNEVILRLMKRLQAGRTRSPQQFLAFAGTCVRWTLLEMLRKASTGPEAVSLDAMLAKAPGDADVPRDALDPGTVTLDPAKLALHTEFFRKLGEAKPLEQAVFEQRYFLGLSNRLAAEVLELPENRTEFLWRLVRLRLADYLKAD